jgi:long-chain acyl-CoA synthetase
MSAYHTTETGAVAIDRTTKSPESVGKVIDGIDLRITASDGSKMGPNDRGVLWIRGKSVAPRSIGPYELPPSRSGRVPVGGRDDDGWYRTGDLGRLDKSGRLFLEGREDDLVKVDGKRVALGEVEGCLEAFPKVKQAQALVITDPLAGPMVVAKVVAFSKCHPEEIIDHCAKNLAPYKVPRRIEFCERLG